MLRVFSVYATGEFSFVLAERVQSDCGELCTVYTMGERKYTVITNLYKNSTQFSAFRSMYGSMRLCTLKKKLCAIQVDRQMRQVHIKPVKESVNLDFFQDQRRGLICAYDSRSLKGTSGGLGSRSIRIAKLTPTEFPNDNTLTVLKRCCAPRGIKDDIWTQQYTYHFIFC